MQPDGHEGVLERRAGAAVGVHVAGGHATELEPPGEGREAAVAGTVIAQERPLELDSQPAWTERVAQQAQRRLVVDATQGAAAQTHEPLGVPGDFADRNLGLGDGPGRSRVCAWARVRIRHRFPHPRASRTSRVR